MRCYLLDPGFVKGVVDKATEETRTVAPPYQGADPKRLGVAFCDGKPCQACRYATICEAALPNVQRAKPTVPM